MECTVSKLVDDTGLCGLEGRATPLRDLDRLEKWTDKNLMVGVCQNLNIGTE